MPPSLPACADPQLLIAATLLLMTRHAHGCPHLQRQISDHLLIVATRLWRALRPAGPARTSATQAMFAALSTRCGIEMP